MKKTALFAALLVLPLANPAHALVPSLISYQGHVADTAGNIGATAPVNRTVTFRLWNHATATANTNKLYAETAVVTINNGDFSVLIGQGTPILTEGAAYTALDANATAIFNSADVYLGITVDDGNTATVDAEITPRQRIVTTAFAMRARIADSVAAGSLTDSALANNAVSTVQIKDNNITTAKILDGNVTTAKILDGNVTSAKIADGTIAAADIADGAITSAKIATGLNLNVGTLTATGTVTGANLTTVGTVTAGTINAGAFTLGSGASDYKLFKSAAGNAWGRLFCSYYSGTNHTAFLSGLNLSYNYYNVSTAEGNAVNSFDNAGDGTSLIRSGSNQIVLATGSGLGVEPTNRLVIDGAGTVSIPGTVKIGGSYNVPGAEEGNLRIIRGTVSSAGAVLYGSGFTVSRSSTGTGQYTVNFSLSFSSTPTVTVSGCNDAQADVRSTVYNVRLAGFSVGNVVSGAWSDASGFSFIVIGPR